MGGHCELTRTELGHLDLAVGELDTDLWLRDDPVVAFADDPIFRGYVLRDLLGLAGSLHAIRSAHSADASLRCGCWEGLVAEFPDAGLEEVADLRDAAGRASLDDDASGEGTRAWAAVRPHLDGLRAVAARYFQ